LQDEPIIFLFYLRFKPRSQTKPYPTMTPVLPNPSIPEKESTQHGETVLLRCKKADLK
jgi:hypothetical protein